MGKRNLKPLKRILALALGVVLAAALAPVAALGAYEPAGGAGLRVAASDDAVEVSDAAGLQAALSSASTDADHPTKIKVAANIEIASSKRLILAVGRYAVLDLNGFQILAAQATSSMNETAFDVTGDLTITDSGSSGIIKGPRSIVVLGNGANFILNGGTLSSSSTSAPAVMLYNNALMDSVASFTLNRGSILSEHNDGVVVSFYEPGTADLKACFTMNGGTVDANHFGVSLDDCGGFVMNGGKLIGANTGVRAWGHDNVVDIANGAIDGGIRGIDILSDTKLTLSGSLEISAPTGVYLNGDALIRFGGPLSVAEPISVDTQVDPTGGPVIVTSGLKGNAAVADFKGAAAHRAVVPSGDEAALIVGEPVTFNANDGTGARATQAVTAGVEAALDANSFSRAGFSFTGWNTAADGSGTAYADGQRVTLYDGLELFAQWKATSATLTFDLAGGTLNGKKGKFSFGVDVGETIDIPAAPEREGYVFDYWKGSEYHPGDKYTVEGDHTFTAVWEKDPNPPAKTHVVTFDANGHGTAPEEQVVADGEPATRPVDPAADGWSFGGWCTDREGKRVYDFSTPVTSDLTLYAKWTRNAAPSPAPIIGTGDPIGAAVLSVLGLFSVILLAMASGALASRRRRREAAISRSKLR